MKKVNSPVKMQEVMYSVNGSGLADVWIRKNQAELPESDEGITGYEADEVCFRVTPDTVSQAEIEADSDFWFDQLKEADDYAVADHLAIANYATTKKKELSAACEATIYAGIDVDLPDGKEHFSLTEKDQINLFGKQAQLASGAEKLEYHQDGQPCKYYSSADMTAIITAAMQFVSYHTTYCNSLNMWIKGCTRASEMAEITYGAAVPEEYQSEVLANYLADATA